MAANYGLEVERFSPMGFGQANSNYALFCKNDEKYLLNIAEEDTPEELKITSRIMDWLVDHGVATPRSIPSELGEYILLYKNKAYMLRSFMEGKVEFDLSEGMLNVVGEQMAALHKVPVPDFLSKTTIYDHPIITDAIGKDLEPEYEKWLKDRLEMLKSRIQPNLPKGFIHGDLFADNIIWDSRSFEGFIDLENACNYFLIYDLGMAIIGLCSKNNELDLEKVSALLDGYQFYRELEPEEKNLLQSFTELAAVHTSNWRYWKFNFHNPNPAKSKTHLDMQALSFFIKSIPKDTFINAINQE